MREVRSHSFMSFSGIVGPGSDKRGWNHSENKSIILMMNVSNGCHPALNCSFPAKAVLLIFLVFDVIKG